MRFILITLSLIFLLTGCAQATSQKSDAQSKENSTSQSKVQAKKQSGGTKKPSCKMTPVRNFSAEDLAESMAKEIQGVDEAVAVFIDDDLDVAVKVTNFNRLRMPEIRKEAFQKFHTFYPEHHIHVSTDGKIYDLLEKLKKEAWSDKEACQKKKKLKEIEDKMRG